LSGPRMTDLPQPAAERLRVGFNAEGQKGAKMVLYTWNENCVLAGRVVPGSVVEERTDGDGNVSDGDWKKWEGTETEIIEWARESAAGPHCFNAKCARAVLDYLDAE